MFTFLPHVLWFIKQFLDYFDKIMSVTGMYFAAQSSSDLFTPEFSQYYGKKTRFALLAFYLSHILLLALTLGAPQFFFSLPYVSYYCCSLPGISAYTTSLLLNVSSIFNAVFEVAQEYYFNRKRENTLQNLKQQLTVLNINYEQNAIIFKDFVDSTNELNNLINDYDMLYVYKEKLGEHGELEYWQCESLLRKVAQEIKSQCDSHSKEYVVMKAYYRTHPRDQNENDVIKTANLEIDRLQSQKQDISNNENIEKWRIIKLHFFKIAKAKATLIEVTDQLQNLDNKYKQAPYNTYAPHETADIKKIESDYLSERKEKLEQFILNPLQEIPFPARRSQTETDIRLKAKDALEKLRHRQDRATLVTILEEQTNLLALMILAKNEELTKKKSFLQSITTNPKDDIKHNFDDLFKITYKINEIEKEIELAELEVTHKLRSSTLSIFSSTMAIVVGLYSHLFDSDFWDTVGKSLTLAGEVMGIFARNEKLKIKINSFYEAAENARIINSEFQKKANIITDTSLRNDLIGQISKRLEEQYPIDATFYSIPILGIGGTFNNQPQSRYHQRLAASRKSAAPKTILRKKDSTRIRFS